MMSRYEPPIEDDDFFPSAADEAPGWEIEEEGGDEEDDELTLDVLARIRVSHLGWGKLAGSISLEDAVLLESVRRCPGGATLATLVNVSKRLAQRMDGIQPLPSSSRLLHNHVLRLVARGLLKRAVLSSKVVVVYLSLKGVKSFACAKRAEAYRVFTHPQFERSPSEE